MSFNTLSIEDVRDLAPAAFEMEPDSKMSDSYAMIRTADVIDPLAQNQWRVVEVSQRTGYKGDPMKKFHVLRLRNEKYQFDGNFVDLVISNSHNGSNAFSIRLGIYRIVCSNGLVTGDDLVQPLSLNHRGLTNRMIVDITMMYVKEYARTIYYNVRDMQRVVLDEPKQVEFAHKAFRCRTNDEKYRLFDVKDLLEPKRAEDTGNDLWTVYNRVQEKVVNAEYSIVNSETGKIRRARKTNSSHQRIELNEKLHNLALEYA